MRTPIHALLWEQWRRTRWIWLAVFAASTAVTLYNARWEGGRDWINPVALRTVMPGASPSDYGTVSRLLPEGSLIDPTLSEDFRTYAMILYLLALFLPLDGSDIKLGLPRYMMTLPSRTTRLAVPQLAYGLVSTALLVLANEAVAAALLGDGLWEMVLLFLAILAVLYALFWTLGILAPRPTLFIAASYAFSSVYFYFVFVWRIADRIYILPEILVTAMSIPIALWGIRRDRNGELAIGALLREGQQSGVLLSRALRPRWFGDVRGLAPLFWLEWKRIYRWIPLANGIFLLLGAIGLVGIARTAPLPVNFRNGGFAHFFFTTGSSYAALVVPFLVCGFIGVLRDTWETRAFRSGTISPEFCRPVNDCTLVYARWLAGAAAIGVSELMLCLVYCIPILLYGGLWRVHPGVLVALLEFGLAHAAVCWMLLWISPLVFAVGLAIGTTYDPHEGPVALFMLIIALLGVAGLIPLAIRRGAVSGLWILLSLLCWPVSYVIFSNHGQFSEVLFDAGPLFFGNQEHVVAGLAAIVLSLTFVWTPFSLYAMRHRR